MSTRNASIVGTNAGACLPSALRSDPRQEETHLAPAGRYIVRNPVRAGSVSDARGYRWSTYRAIAARNGRAA